ncbi:MAG: hypothetical protein WGN25_17395 [Candidatus Electrothrix sp. GW3-4]|uniref:hypothetical protein n=1 Tax=Candidatus Electrothrix sp. GW3-4 TaxID=3126740 RepID=UPI0030CDE404
MKDYIHELLKNQPLALIIIASLLALITASGGMTIGGLTFSLPSNEWRILIGIFAIIILIAAIISLFGSNIVMWPNGDKGSDLYTALGLKTTVRDDSIFQNFEIHRPDGNINAVHYLWADTYKGGKISAYVNNSEYFLRIEFDNIDERSYPSNIAIRPQNEEPIKIDQKKRFLSFEARRADDSIQPIAVAVRVVNQYLQHWWYAQHGGECKQFKVVNAQWKKFVIDLYDKDSWKLFDSDGYYKKDVKDPFFDILGSVIFEFGIPNDIGRPRGGKGTIDIRRIKVTCNAS